jgi:hypothetical protein
MDIFYIFIIAICFVMLGSTKIHTDTALKILGIGLIITGALIHLRADNPLIEIGVISYLLCDCLNAYFRRKNQRITDKATT